MSDTPQQVREPQVTAPQRRGHSWWRLTIGAAVVLFGGVMLAHAFGWHWSFRPDVLRFWPVLIIFFGMSLLARGRRSSVLLRVGISLCTVIYIGLVVLQITAQPKHSTTTMLRVERLVEAKSAKLDMHLGAIALTVRGGATDMVNGRYQSNVGTLTGTSIRNGNVQDISYTNTASMSSGWTGGMRNDLDIQLHNDVPIIVNLDTGASSIHAQLSDLLVSSATIHSGASSIAVDLGDRLDASSLTITAGASSIDITIPSSVGVAAHISSGLSSRDVPKFHERSKNEYESDNYSTSTKKLDLRIEAGVSSIAIHWK